MMYYVKSAVFKGFNSRCFLSCLMVAVFLLSCAREKPYVLVIKPPPTKSIILPETSKGKIPGSYVVNGERYYPLPDSFGFVQTGKASWYGSKFHGKPTASGEKYDMYKPSAAHKTLPLGTYVKVQNLSNKRHIIVRINDRGPFVKGRIIDLSYASAKEIELIGPGVVDVRVTALGKEVGKSEAETGSRPLVELKDLETGDFTIQVGAFMEKDNAKRLVDRLKVLFGYVNIVQYVDNEKRILYRVHASLSKTLSQAGETEKKLEEMGFSEAFIVRI